jgi:putative flippase GtrA
VLWLLRGKLQLDYLIATALAVEAAIIHNFVWHDSFTWADRSSHGSRIIRFSKFNAATGLFSIAGNLLLMKTLVEAAHLQYLAANLIAIGSCSILNFIASDRFVFYLRGNHSVRPKSDRVLTITNCAGYGTGTAPASEASRSQAFGSPGPELVKR